MKQLRWPAQDSGIKNYREATIKQWLAELPLADFGRSASLLAGEISAIPQVKLNPSELFLALETFRPVVESHMLALRKSYLAQTAIPITKRKTIIDYATQMIDVLIPKYNHLILSTKEDTILDDTKTAHALYHAVKLNLESMLLHYHLYEETPHCLWENLNELYRTAVTRECIDQPIEVITEGHACKTTIGIAYHSALLLSLANPFQLQQQDIERIYKGLAHWGALVSVTEYPSKSLFAINIASDAPPNYQQLMAGKNDQAMKRGIQTAKLTNYLQGLLAESRLDENTSYTTTVESSGELLPKHLLKHLLQSWGEFPTRAFPRTEQAEAITICVGLAAAHHYMSGEKIFLPDGRSYAKSSTSDESNVINVDFSKEETKKSEKIARNYHKHRWHVLNTCPTGFCLCTASDFPVDVAVGEVIGIQEADKDGSYHWHVGVIRWIKFEFGKQVQIGVQLLANAATAVGIRTQKQSERSSQFLRALLLPDAMDGDATLLTLPLPYRAGDCVEVLSDNFEYSIELTEAHEVKGLFKQFSFVRQ